jgi:hypothetical protein
MSVSNDGRREFVRDMALEHFHLNSSRDAAMKMRGADSVVQTELAVDRPWLPSHAIELDTIPSSGPETGVLERLGGAVRRAYGDLDTYSSRFQGGRQANSHGQNLSQDVSSLVSLVIVSDVDLLGHGPAAYSYDAHAHALALVCPKNSLSEIFERFRSLGNQVQWLVACIVVDLSTIGRLGGLVAYKHALLWTGSFFQCLDMQMSHAGLTPLDRPGTSTSWLEKELRLTRPSWAVLDWSLFSTDSRPVGIG